MDTDLSHIIASQQTLTDAHIKYFLYQILRGLKFIHSAGVLHRDLKPQNVLVNASCELVVCDFGLARATGRKCMTHAGPSEASAAEDELEAELTKYVVTRWYRAPELLAQASTYDAAADVWSVGCILAEILGRRPLLPGRNHHHQMQVIVDLLGSPATEDLWFVPPGSAVHRIISAVGAKRRVSFRRLFPRANPQAVDLLEKMLHFNPSKRITVLEALEHPYVADYHYADDEPEAPSVVKFDFDAMGRLSKPFLQARMVDEILEYAHYRHTRPLPSRGLITGAASAAPAASSAPVAPPEPPAAPAAVAATAAAAAAAATAAAAAAGAAKDSYTPRAAAADAAEQRSVDAARRVTAQKARAAMAALDDEDDDDDRGGQQAAAAPAPAPAPAAAAARAPSAKDDAKAEPSDAKLAPPAKARSVEVAAAELVDAKLRALAGELEAKLVAAIESRIERALLPVHQRIDRIQAQIATLQATRPSQ
jgi:hypothetical protein